jgi:hypothetical protein
LSRAQSHCSNHHIIENNVATRADDMNGLSFPRGWCLHFHLPFAMIGHCGHRWLISPTPGNGYRLAIVSSTPKN